MKLTGAQYQHFTESLLDAFPTPNRLAQMLQFRLGKNLHALALGDDLQELIFKVIGVAEAEGWTMRLVAAARDSNPGNPLLLVFAQQFGLAPMTPPRSELERIIKSTQSFLDINAWRTRLGQIEGQVCRVEICKGSYKNYGTGFLLGPDIVITNYHVVEDVIDGAYGLSSKDIVLRFDYKRVSDGTTLYVGTEYRLVADKWLPDSSPNVWASGILPQEDQLDYAFLRVAGMPGHDPIGGIAEPSASARKWIVSPPALTQSSYPARTPLFIVQHPQGDPLKLALDTDGIIATNANGTRLTYHTNTEPGSSGSPCFNSNWELLALHHSGDPNFESNHHPEYNEGIPFTAITRLLEKRGLSRLLGEPEL